MGTERAAAVNLLCMAQSQSSLQQFGLEEAAPEATCAEPQVTPVLLCNTAAIRCLSALLN